MCWIVHLQNHILFYYFIVEAGSRVVQAVFMLAVQLERNLWFFCLHLLVRLQACSSYTLIYAVWGDLLIPDVFFQLRYISSPHILFLISFLNRAES